MTKKSGKKPDNRFFTRKRVVIVLISMIFLPFLMFWIVWSIYALNIRTADLKLEKAAEQYINVPEGWEHEGVTLCGVGGCGIAIDNYSESKFSNEQSLDFQERRSAINSFSNLNGNFETKDDELNCGEQRQGDSNGCFRVLTNGKHQVEIEVYGSSGKTFLTVRVEKDDK